MIVNPLYYKSRTLWILLRTMFYLIKFIYLTGCYIMNLYSHLNYNNITVNQEIIIVT